MKHAVIVAHPKARSFTMTLAKAYAAAATQLGHEVILRDLYRMRFDPRLQAGEIPGPGGFKARPGILAERERLKDVGAFAFFYPVWFNAPPAILKGYMDRVFTMGFGYGPGPVGTEPLLRGRRFMSVSSSGAPKDWMEESGAWDAMRKLFDDHFAAVTGLSVLEHLHFGGITPNITRDAVRDCATKVRVAVAKHY